MYIYYFMVDGVRVLDPSNPQVKVGYVTSTTVSLLTVPTPESAFYAVRDVPHGEIRTLLYASASNDVVRELTSDSVVGGLIESEEQTLITNIFDFSHLYVGQIMTPRTRMDAVPITITIEELMQTMFTSPHTRLPVYEDDLDHILGIIHLKDLVHHHLENSVFDLKTLLHPIPFVPERLQADRLLARLKHDKIHMAIVLDEYGGTAGLITLEDLIEEVVGDVHDEFDTEEEPDIKVIEPGHLMVAGEARLDEIKEFINLETEEEDVDTVGGLLIAHISLPPKIGAKTTINGAILQVEALDGLTIQQVSIRYEPDTRGADDTGTAK